MKFSVVAKFSGCEGPAWDLTVKDVERESVRRLGAQAVDVTEPGDSEYAYLADEGSEEWREAYDVTVSGLFDRETFDAWVDALYLRADDTETMGTLGGPLSMGCVPDIVFELREQWVIDSIRVTPVIEDRNGEPLPNMERVPEEQRADVAERTWQRIRKATLAVYGPNR